jgi:tetratricopeptide (TPR) repeat protein
MNEQYCQRVSSEMSSVLDGSAPAALLEHVATCDTCRDARHDAEQAARLVAASGRDFRVPDGLVEQLVNGVAEAPVASPAPPQKREPPRLRPLAQRWGVPLLAAMIGAVVLAGRARSTGTSADDPELVGPPWRGHVEKVLTHGGKLELCAPRGGACRALGARDEVPAGSLLRTDRSTLAELSFTDGSRVSLDRETTLRLSTQGRGGELVAGGIVAEVQHQEGSGARFALGRGHVDVLGTKLALRAEEGSATVHVARGQVRLSDGAGHDVLVAAGEQGRLDPGSAPVASPTRSLGEALGWAEAVRQDVEDEPEPRPRALGELKAKKPGEQGERAGAVQLESHAVRVKIAGSVARTEVEEVFRNQTDEVLEGIFRFPLPPDAKIERLALEVDGKLEEGAFVERERASAIWRGAIVNAAPQLRPQLKEEIVWVPGPWRDPALLEWQRGGRFELRIFPIPKRGSRKVVLAYSQVVARAASVRHYSYPLGFDPSGNATPLRFSVDVRVTGHDPSLPVRAPGWSVDQRREGGAVRLAFEASSFVPSGDFTVDYALPEQNAELTAWAYRDPRPGSESQPAYVAVALRPRLPKPTGVAERRAVALVVDASRSMYGESYRRATRLATRIARELPPSDRLAVLACDSSCRELPGGLRAAGPSTAREVRRFLESEAPEGASDVSLAVEQGFTALRGADASPHVVYIGDGAATVGPTRPSTLERAARRALPPRGRVTALGIGPESDPASLGALARGGSGTALPYLPGQPLADAALAAISALSGAVLDGPRLQLPAGVSLVAPARLDPIAAGTELIVTGRTTGEGSSGEAVLTGTVDGRPFEQRYRLDLSASASSGNAFVPRLFAGARIADLERDGSEAARREAIALSTEHGVASRYTSLLVLESEAMYQAFGLERAGRAADYTAEVEAEGASANGELALGPDEPADDAKSEASASRGPARASLGAAAAKPAAPLGDALDGSFDAPSPATRFAPAPPPAGVRIPEPERKKVRAIEQEERLEELRPRPRMIPMRRIWERRGEVSTERTVPRAASDEALRRALRELENDGSRRQALKRAFALSSAAGDLGEAARLAERWVEKEPLDPEALTALADVQARRGRRDLAIRLLGSVLDVRPGDTAAHLRLARLERWAGHAEAACRHGFAMAESKSRDLGLVAEAVRCTRALGLTDWADALLDAANAADRAEVERRASAVDKAASGLSGDVRVEASWTGGSDLDLALIDTDGHRISWLGAATRSVISAVDPTSTGREGLALRGALPGEYVLELTRGGGVGSASGELVVTAAGKVRRIPFTFEGERKTVALLRLTMEPRLVPL